jgi:hypothetical protein
MRTHNDAGKRWRMASRNAAMQIALEAAVARHEGSLPVPCRELLVEAASLDLAAVDMTREFQAALADLDRIARAR